VTFGESHPWLSPFGQLKLPKFVPDKFVFACPMTILSGTKWVALTHRTLRVHHEYPSRPGSGQVRPQGSRQGRRETKVTKERTPHDGASMLH
jgi:hypothetical protein